MSRHHAGIHGRLLRVVPLPAPAEIPDQRYAALDQQSLRVLQPLLGREQRELLRQQILLACRAGEELCALAFEKLLIAVIDVGERVRLLLQVIARRGLSSTFWNALSTVWRYVATAPSHVACASCTAAVRAPASKIVATSAGPSVQTRFGSENRFARVLCWKPPVAVNSRVGKNAASATPMRALAAAAVRSAATMSGRRSSSSDGNASGTVGGANA